MAADSTHSPPPFAGVVVDVVTADGATLEVVIPPDLEWSHVSTPADAFRSVEVRFQREAQQEPAPRKEQRMAIDSTWWQDAAGAAGELARRMDGMTVSVVDELLAGIDPADRQQAAARTDAEGDAVRCLRVLRGQHDQIERALDRLDALVAADKAGQ